MSVEPSKILTVLQVYSSSVQDKELAYKYDQVLLQLLPWIVQQVDEYITRLPEDKEVSGLDVKLLEKISEKFGDLGKKVQTSVTLQRFIQKQKKLNQHVDLTLKNP